MPLSITAYFFYVSMPSLNCALTYGLYFYMSKYHFAQVMRNECPDTLQCRTMLGSTVPEEMGAGNTNWRKEGIKGHPA